MDFVRRNLFFVICLAVAGGAIALGVMGMQKMPEVNKEMQNVASLYNNLSTLKPVSLDGYKAQQKRIDTLVSDRKNVFSKAKELYGYEPLVPSALPNGDAIAGNEFRVRYKKAMQALFDKLKSGKVPDTRDISFWRNEIENEKAAEEEKRKRSGRIRFIGGKR